MPSAHVRAGSLIAEFVDRCAVKPASECIAQGLGQALVLVVVRLNLAIAVAPLTLLRVRVHLEVQRATEDLACTVSMDVELVVPLGVAVGAGPSSAASGALELDLHVHAILPILRLERLQLIVHSIVHQRVDGDFLGASQRFPQAILDKVCEVCRCVNHL